MLLDGLAQGTGTLAVYDADIFQMCQIGVVQIFIEGGEGFVYRFAQQIDLGGNGEGLGLRSLPVFVLDMVGVVIVASSMRTRSFMFVEVRMIPHCTKRLPFASGRLLTVPLSPMDTMRTASPFLSCSGFNAGALGLSFAATESLLFLSSMLLRSF